MDDPEKSRLSEEIFLSLFTQNKFLVDGVTGPVKSINTVEDLFELYTVLFNYIDIETNEFRGERKITEDLKLHVLRCAKVIVDHLTENLIQDFLSKPSLYPILGHSIHVSLNIGLKEKYKELQLSSLNFITCLVRKFDSYDKPNETGPLPADILASFLPGISIAVMKIVLSDDKLPAKLYNECLKTLETTVKATLNTKVSSIPIRPEERIDFVINRNVDWLKASCIKLEVVFDKIIKSLLTRSVTLVRMKLLTFSQEIIFTLAELEESPEETLITLLEVPLIMATDSDEDISEAAQFWLTEFSNDTLINKPSLRDSLLERLHQLLTTITRELQCISEDQKLAKFKLIEGYFICLGPQGLTSFIASQSCQDRLLTSLINCSAFNETKSTQGYKLIEMLDMDTIENRTLKHLNYPKKHFKHFDSPDLQTSLRRICAQLGCHLNGFSLADYFTSLMADGPRDPAIIFICNQTIQGIQNVDILSGLFHEYVNQLTLLTLSLSSPKVDHPSNSTLALSLLLEGLTLFASKYGPSKQYIVLLNSLYLILAHTGSDRVIISDSALTTLQRLAENYSYPSIQSLISENLDYVLNHLNLRLNSFESNRHVCPVIHSILNLSGPQILPFTEFTLENVLTSIDIYYNLNCTVLVDLLKIVINFIGKHFTSHSESPERSDFDSIKVNEETRKRRFIQQLTQFLEARKIVNSMDDQGSAAPVNTETDQSSGEINLNIQSTEKPIDDESDQEKEKKDLPIEIKLTIKILERCCHLLSNPSTDIQIVSMEIIKKGLRILRPWEDEILPLAHKLWTPIATRFRTDNLSLLTKCYHCLLVMSQCCGQFLRLRTLEQIVPRLISFLKSQASISFGRRENFSAYKQTLEYRLQFELLSTLGLICHHLNIEGISLWPIVEVIIPYLSREQPKGLQEGALKSCKYLLILDPFAFNCLVDQMVDFFSDKERKNYFTNLKILSNIKL